MSKSFGIWGTVVNADFNYGEFAVISSQLI